MTVKATRMAGVARLLINCCHLLCIRNVGVFCYLLLSIHKPQPAVMGSSLLVCPCLILALFSIVAHCGLLEFLHLLRMTYSAGLFLHRIVEGKILGFYHETIWYLLQGLSRVFHLFLPLAGGQSSGSCPRLQ